MATAIEIPTIDINPFLCNEPSATSRERLIDDVRKAGSEYGFFQITGHGVPVTLQRQVFEACVAFFALPSAKKHELSIKNNQRGRGYEDLEEQQLDANSAPDRKEGFNIGREMPLTNASFLKGPNQWPDLPSEEFRCPIMEYYEHMERLGCSILQMVAAGLGYDRKVLQTLTKEPFMHIKLLHYPPHRPGRNEFGAGEHTDFGGITVLLQQAGVSSLQVYHKGSDQWLSVPAREDVLVINMGDLMHKWTGGRYSSVLHRVINANDGDRYSVPCFYQGDLDATNPFAPHETADDTVGEHITRKFVGSYEIST